MGNIYKQKVTRPLPENATIQTRRRRATEKELRINPGLVTVVESLAVWADRNGKKQMGVVVLKPDGSKRVRTQSATYYARFRDGDGVIQDLPTGCRDKQAAMNFLAERVKRSENVRSKITTTATDRIIDHQTTPLILHLAAYLDHQKVKGLNARRQSNSKARLNRLATECNWGRLSDLSGDSLEGWLADQMAAGMTASTRNEYRQESVGFVNWCKRTHRILDNPFAFVSKADNKNDTRKQRRAMTAPELQRLLYVARWRPLAEFGRETVRKTVDDLPTNGISRKSWTKKPLTFAGIPAAVERARDRLADNPKFVAELELLGVERSLVYKVAVLTGLRRGELESLTVGHLDLNNAAPLIRMESQDTKNGEAVDISLQAELANDLRSWLDAKRAERGPHTIGGDVLPMHRN